MFTTRLISGIILVLLAVLFVGKGGLILFGVTALISLVGLFELYRVLGIENRSVGAVGYITALSYYGILWWEGHEYLNLYDYPLSDGVNGSLCILPFQSTRQKRLQGLFSVYAMFR